MNWKHIAGTCVLGIALVLHIIGTATSEWTVSKGNAAAVFKLGVLTPCGDSVCSSLGIPHTEVKVCAAFAVIGLLSCFLGLVFALSFAILSRIGKSPGICLPACSMAAAVVAFVCVFITVMVWGGTVHDPIVKYGAEFGYSYALSFTGGSLMAIGGILVFLGRSHKIQELS